MKVLCQFLCFLPKIRSNGLKQESKAAICLYSADKNIEIAENPPPQSGAAGKRRPSGCRGARDCQKPCRKGGGGKGAPFAECAQGNFAAKSGKNGLLAALPKKDAGVPARCLRPAFAILLLRSFAACCSASAGRAALFVPDGALHFGRFAVYLFQSQYAAAGRRPGLCRRRQPEQNRAGPAPAGRKPPCSIPLRTTRSA